MKRVLVPVGVLFALLVLSLVLEHLLGGERPWLNVIRHLSLGAAGAWFSAEAWNWASVESFRSAPWWFRAITLVAGAILLCVSWELLEYQFNLVASRTDVGNPYDDTMKDLRMDIVGALLVIPFVCRRRDR